jgi:UDP-N-acetylmuramyl tripeptide synthase
MVARRIDPDLLHKVVAASAAQKVVVSGSNGKTTTCRMIAAVAQQGGRRVTQNRTGSNLLQGVTSVAVNGSNLLGKLETDLLLFEIDEATVPAAVKEFGPDVLVVTNIFRDQLDRYGELYAVAGALERTIASLPSAATVVLNGDDPLIANFAATAPSRRLYFGLRVSDEGGTVPEHAADTVRCVRCQHALIYDRVYISHLGAFRCPNCGYSRPQLQVAVTGLMVEPVAQSRVKLETPRGELTMELPLPGLHNVYNLAAAVAAMIALGVDLAGAGTAIAALTPAFGRLETIQAGGKTVVLGFVKNPISYNTTLRTILQQPGQFDVLSAHSNTLVDGEDFAWLWDVDLEEAAPRIRSLVVSGTKAAEVAMRFKYAGVKEENMIVIEDRGKALDTALRKIPAGGKLHILAGYTPTHELRRLMVQRGWVRPFWEG